MQIRNKMMRKRNFMLKFLLCMHFLISDLVSLKQCSDQIIYGQSQPVNTLLHSTVMKHQVSAEDGDGDHDGGEELDDDDKPPVTVEIELSIDELTVANIITVT